MDKCCLEQGKSSLDQATALSPKERDAVPSPGPHARSLNIGRLQAGKGGWGFNSGCYRGMTTGQSSNLHPWPLPNGGSHLLWGTWWGKPQGLACTLYLSGRACPTQGWSVVGVGLPCARFPSLWPCLRTRVDSVQGTGSDGGTHVEHLSLLLP